MRELASEVSAFAEIVPCFHLGIPSATKIVQAGSELIGLSNSFYVKNEETRYVHIEYNGKRRDSIKNLLGLKKMPQ